MEGKGAPQAEIEAATDLALTQMAEVIHAAADAIRRNVDPSTEFEKASRFVEIARDALELGGTLRAQSAGRIHAAESLSLAGLANRLGISKARADQLINAAKSAREEKIDGRTDDSTG